jgi:hypothetical protein
MQPGNVVLLEDHVRHTNHPAPVDATAPTPHLAVSGTEQRPRCAFNGSSQVMSVPNANPHQRHCRLHDHRHGQGDNNDNPSIIGIRTGSG